MLARKVDRRRPWKYRAVEEFAADENAVAIDHVTLENEGWERGHSVVEPAEPSR